MPYARAIEAFERGADRWALPLLGVLRAARGTGVGSALLRDACTRADDAGRAIGLETQAPRNLPLYERFGFRILSEFQPAPEAAPMWLLARAPDDPVAPGRGPR
jgi:GNAT superfamily N-acetyltransferase